MLSQIKSSVAGSYWPQWWHRPIRRHTSLWYAFCPQNKRMLFHTFLSGASVLSGWPSTYLSIRARLGGRGVVGQEGGGEGYNLTHTQRTGLACWWTMKTHRTGSVLLCWTLFVFESVDCKKLNCLCVWLMSVCVPGFSSLWEPVWALRPL